MGLNLQMGQNLVNKAWNWHIKYTEVTTENEN